MIRDFEDLCTWMYVLISELCAALDPVLVRPGPSPVCTDAELITMAIVGECCGWDQETVLLSRWREHRDLFPRQPERTRFNRRRRALAPTINLLRQAVVDVLDVAQDPQCVIDSLPIPVVQFYYVPQATTDWKAAGASFGHCCSKKQAIFGFKLHLLITQVGLIRDFELAPANLTDREVGAELLAAQMGPTCLYWPTRATSADRSPRSCTVSTTSACSPCRVAIRRPSPRRPIAICTRICAK